MKRTKLIKSEVMKIFNTTKETLRHYENMELIEPEIDDQNYRYYDQREIRKLRQIFYLRELDIPLDQIRRLERGELSRNSYIDLLSDHHKRLVEKMERQKHLLRNTEHLINLLEDSSFARSFTVNRHRERSFFLVEKTQLDSFPDMKSYYDLYSPLIERGIYTERSFILIYPYDNLADPLFIEGIQCLEIAPEKISKEDNIKKFPMGTYLSVFYLFEDGRNEDLAGLYDEIERYLKSNNLKRIGDTVLEMEHPELSVIFEENRNIYELQIEVEKSFS